MKIGVYIFPTDYSIGIVELARALEERGFGSLFVRLESGESILAAGGAMVSMSEGMEIETRMMPLVENGEISYPVEEITIAGHAGLVLREGRLYAAFTDGAVASLNPADGRLFW